MRPSAFIAKWSESELRESQGAQEHFIDLCHLLGQPTPAEDDPTGMRYCFERGASKASGGDGWADVWRRGCFAFEYKGKHKNLDAAFVQLDAYRADLENPPYLVVSDMERIIVRTNWTNTVQKTFALSLEDLRDPSALDILRQVFEGSEKLKPGISPQQLTAKVATRFSELSQRLQQRGHAPRAVAHFLNRLVFCMFAEDCDLLPKGLFTRTVKGLVKFPERAEGQLGALFGKMASRDDRFFGADFIRWFNGGLFEDAATLPLEAGDLKLIVETAEEHDWSEIDPAIFGTLFEQALKATRERPALGAHYTDRAMIMKIVEPVVIRPLAAEWQQAKADIVAALAEAEAAEAERKAFQDRAADLFKEGREAVRAGEAARRKQLTAIERRRVAAGAKAADRLEAYLARLGAFRVLDPACGSGNFLYVALHALMDLERRAIVDAERLGLAVPAPRVGLQAVRGIEIEPYAAELARMTLWIGYLQWNRKNDREPQDPVLSSLDQIEARDALLNEDGTEAEWPKVDVIIGNPPFLGDRRMIGSLGEQYVIRLRKTFEQQVPGGADFVCYWVAKAWRAIGAKAGLRAGLVATNSIRGGANRKVLDAMAIDDAIHMAWADEPWILDGAAVRVSMLGFGEGFVDRLLDGTPVEFINSDLTASTDLREVHVVLQNRGVAYIGDQKNGPFDITAETARSWLRLPLNPNGRSNSEVLFPWTNGLSVVRRDAGNWIIDFGPTMDEGSASLYEVPFEYVAKYVRPTRIELRRDWHRTRWWLHGDPRPALRRSIRQFSRYLVSPRVSKHRLFVWRPTLVLADSATVAIARDDDTTFGILHSRFHELWSLRMGTWLGVGNDPRYTPSTTFETFPFPDGLTPNIPAADYAADPRAIRIAEAAADLNRLREAWLNPADLVVVVPEIVPTAAPGEEPVKYPDRVLPRDENAAKELKKRTLTNLYNERPTWLANAHRRLDAAVASAYGWPADLSDEDILARLFALNQERAAAGR